MSIYSGFHIGIVVENDDPNYGGRVKVYVPEHSPNLDKLNKWIKEGKEIKFNAIDKDISPELVEILDDLKESLPWAEYAGPIFGGSSDGRFRCATKTTSTNDDTSFGKNDAQNGYRPLNKFMGDGVPIDDFYARDGRTIVMPNQNATDYEPSNYSGMVRGIFSIPNVGAQVYVFYLNDDPMYPVYFAAAYNPDSIKQIFSQTHHADNMDGLNKVWDYPNEFENGNENTDESKIFRSKTVINSNKHTIEFIDTDGYEALRFQHFGGGFKQFHNYGAVEFTPGHDQQLVLGDQFLTVHGDRGVSIGGNESFRVRGNSHVQIGEYSDNVENVTKIKEALDELGDIKRLFSVKRTDYSLPPRDTSTKQKRSAAKGKGFITCPTCGGLKYDPYNVNGLNPGGTYVDTQKVQDEYIKTYISLYDSDSQDPYASGEVDGFLKIDKTAIEEDVEYGWSRIPKALQYCNPEFSIPPSYFSPEYLSGTKTSDENEDVSINDVTNINPAGDSARPHEKHQGTGKVGIFGGIRCPTCNNKLWQESPQTSAWIKDAPLSGYSPSTEKGNWAEEDQTKSALGKKIASKFSDVSQSLVAMGDGGDRIETITMSKVENIGTVFNDIPSFRVDPIGKLRLDGLFVTQQSTVPYYLPTPHVEPVDVVNVPGGDYNLTIGNKWNVMVGSNGINIKTTGSLQIGGAISSIATQELNLSAKHDMVIDGGERLMIRARKVTVNPVEHNALTVDGQVHVLRNMIVRGGTLIEGELAVQHVTAPGELAVTGPEMWLGSVEERCEVPAGFKIGASSLEAVPKLEGTKYGLNKAGAMTVDFFGALTGGLVSGITGLVSSAVGGIGKVFGHKSKKNLDENTMKSAINSIGTTVNGILSLLNSDMEVTLKLPYHKHTFLQIPTIFKDCPNAVRAELLAENRNINSRQIVVSSHRRHHIGNMTADPLPMEVYLKNKMVFDEMIYDAIIRIVPALQTDLTIKGFTRGVQPGSIGPGSPTTYGMFFYSGVSGNMGTCLFYTVIDYYTDSNPGRCLVDAKITNNYSNFIVRLDFELANESDDSSMGDLEGTSQTSVTNTNTYSAADLAAGYVINSAKAQIVQGGGSSTAFGMQFQNAKSSAESQRDIWNATFGKYNTNRCPTG